MLPALQTPFLAYGADATNASDVTRAPADTTPQDYGPDQTPKARHFTYFTADLEDREIKTAMRVVAKRIAEGKTASTGVINEMMHIHVHLQQYAMDKYIGTPEGWDAFMGDDQTVLLPPDFVGFVKHLSIIGHGNHGTDTLPAVFSFGETGTETHHLRDYANAGISLARYMAPGGTIHLEGCSTGRGPQGKEYAFQLGRIMFGQYKRGTIILNQIVATSVVADMQGGDPRSFRWPEDFQDEAWGSIIDIVEMMLPDPLLNWRPF